MGNERIGVVGAGAFGTALAQSISQSGHDIIIWSHSSSPAQDINQRHVNSTFLPGIELGTRIQATEKLSDLEGCQIILLACPAQFIRSVVTELAPYTNTDTTLLICAKGIEIESKTLMSQVVSSVLRNVSVAVLSGPSFAHEVAQGLPAALTLACTNNQLGLHLINLLGHTNLRLYWSSDIIGAQIGGAVKNVMAIACGICDGKGLGQSAHAALTTRGYVELVEIAKIYGGKPETLTGLSGLGDLILTCSSPKSRNMSLGKLLGQGQSLEEILGSRKSVTEGIYTAEAIAGLAKSKGIELPISSTVHQILKGEYSVDHAIEKLLSRPFKAEL